MITVLIPTTGDRPDLLGATVKSLACSDGAHDGASIVIVENGSPKYLEDSVRRLDAKLNVRYLFLAEANKSAALNAALETVPGGLVVFVDDDVHAAPGLLTYYRAAAQQYGPRHFFGGPVACDYEEPPAKWIMPHLPPSATGWRPAPGGMREDEFFLGFNWAAFVCDLRNAGDFDQHFGPGAATGATGQETNMQRRLRACGVEPVYLHAAMVWHYVPRERCSWSWALGRAYRGGIARGLADASAAGGRLRRTRYVWQCLYRAVGNAVVGVIACSRYRRCRAQVHFQRWRGARQGLKLDARQSRCDAAPRCGGSAVQVRPYE